MTVKKKVKLAIIRGDELRPCPYGLPMIDACQNAGESIHRMAPLVDMKDEQAAKVSKANRLVYAHNKDGQRCPYADKVLEENNKVDCDFGDTGEGQHSVPFRGSPMYPQTFTGIGGMYGFPLGFYGDNNESRNLFFGLFSMLGVATTDELIKLADTYDKSKEEEKADILDGLLEKLQKVKDEYSDTFNKVENYLDEYRKEYKDKRTDTGLLWELTNAWFGPRQVNR